MTPTTTTAMLAFTSMAATKGDDSDLVGRPSTVGGFNFTTGVAIYSAFLFAFLVAVGFATVKRAQIRKRFFGDKTDKGNNKNNNNNSNNNINNLEILEAGLIIPKDVNEKAILEESPSKQDHKVLMTEGGEGAGRNGSGSGGASQREMGRNARLAEAAAKSRQEANGITEDPAASRFHPGHEVRFDDKNVERAAVAAGATVRFDRTARSDSVRRSLLQQQLDQQDQLELLQQQQQQPSYPEKSSARRASARKSATPSPELVANEKFIPDSITGYEDDYHDATPDYEDPSLTGSTDLDPYYSSSMPRPVYQQIAARPLQPSISVAGTRPPRAAAHGLVSRPASVSSQASSVATTVSATAIAATASTTTTSGIAPINHGRTRSNGSPALRHHQSAGDLNRLPTTITRSNSSRVPPSMRVGSPSPYASSGHSGTYM
ncbi:hypothetical protein BGZ65_009288 [Modicella reniformis]|uniref:Uncharacterized protein n=1 Tax=Modicella reniformis TaxID=1440133 RepID=A0A9P6LQE4_9FUNG|nr:hypothetical protein BGZ65_009288 [Modicella reniformis]